MKFDQVKVWKLAGKVAAVAALGAVAPAQTSQSSAGDLGARKGRAFEEVSLENDMRTPWAAHNKIVLQRPAEDQGSLELVLKMRYRTKDLDAFMPSIDDMETSLVLMNGTPGAVAVIHLDTRASELRQAGGTRIVGFFDEDGRFSAALPRGFQADGILAHGEEMTLTNLHASAGGGRAVPASKRPTTDGMDVEEVVTKAYYNWARWYAELYTNLQFKGGKLRSASLDDRDADDSASVVLSSSGLVIGGGHVRRGSVVDDDTDIGQEEEVIVDIPGAVRGKGALGKIALQRPQRPVLDDGHTLPGSGADDDTDIGDDQQVLVDPSDPIGGKRAFGKIKLQRPARPALGGGHVLPGSGVDDDTDIGADDGDQDVSVDLADPVGGKRAFGKIALQKPARPALGGGHTLPGSGVDDDTNIGADDGDQDASVDLPDPVGGKRAFGKIKLQRPQQPAQRDDHVLQRKL